MEVMCLFFYRIKQEAAKSNKQLFDVDTIETSGSGINEDILSLIKTAASTRGVIVLTDPDYPGTQIRNKVIQAVPNAKHAFVAKKDAKGVKKLGIAEARHDAIIEALENAVTFSDAKESISWDEFIDLDVLGNKKRRLQVYDAFHLGYGNAKALFKRLNMMGITKEEVLKALKSQQTQHLLTLSFTDLLLYILFLLHLNILNFCRHHTKEDQTIAQVMYKGHKEK